VLAAGAGVGGALLVAAGARRTVARVNAVFPGGQDQHDGMETGDQPTIIPWEPADLVEPEVRRAVDGVLTTELRARYGYHDIGGYRLFTRGYEETNPGPTLRLQPGDTLRLNLINDLPPDRDTTPLNTDQPHKLNTTNFHFHGAHVSPSGISDNIFRQMEPGQSNAVEITLPADHPRGTYWYHPHHHGGADIQIASGMAGAIVIEGDFADVPEIAAATERVLVLGEVVFDAARTVEAFESLWSEVATRFVAVNGQREPVIRLRPGEVQRWRIVHTGYQNDLLLGLAGHALHAIAADGVGFAGIERTNTLLMAPGQRADILIQGGAPGTYALSAFPHDQGYPSPTGPLATVVVAGEPLPMDLPTALPSSPFAAIADAELTGSRRLVFSARGPENDAAGYWQEFDFLVDGRLFDPDRVDQRVTLGAVEEWTIVNEHVHDHVFHIHVNPCQVTAVNGEALAVGAPVWRDTMIVPGNGSLVFRTRFLDFTGRYVLHCHMMNHEELGMMQVVEVVAGA